MRELDRLVTPVVDAAKPGDLLIFSPTGFLFSLPLHALSVSRSNGSNYMIHLIERNPVVYAPSISILQICLTKSRDNTQPNLRPSIFFGIHPRWRRWQQASQLTLFRPGRERSRCCCGESPEGHQEPKRRCPNAFAPSGHATSTDSISDPGSGHEVLLSQQKDENVTENCLLVPEVFDLGLTVPLVILIRSDSALQMVCQPVMSTWDSSAACSVAALRP